MQELLIVMKSSIVTLYKPPTEKTFVGRTMKWNCSMKSEIKFVFGHSSLDTRFFHGTNSIKSFIMFFCILLESCSIHGSFWKSVNWTSQRNYPSSSSIVLIMSFVIWGHHYVYFACRWVALANNFRSTSGWIEHSVNNRIKPYRNVSVWFLVTVTLKGYTNLIFQSDDVLICPISNPFRNVSSPQSGPVWWLTWCFMTRDGDSIRLQACKDDMCP